MIPVLRQPFNYTGGSNVTYTNTSPEPPRYGWFLTFEDAVKVHHALYLAYGNEDRAAPLWEGLRLALGSTAWERVVEWSGKQEPR